MENQEQYEVIQEKPHLITWFLVILLGIVVYQNQMMYSTMKTLRAENSHIKEQLSDIQDSLDSMSGHIEQISGNTDDILFNQQE